MNAKARHQPGARFLPLLTRAQADEQRALKQLAEAQKLSAREHQKLLELKNHSERTHSADIPQMPGALTNRHAFMTRLSEAIRQQQRQVHQVEKGVEQARQSWLAMNHNTQRYQRLIENELRRAQLSSDRREQKDLDEIALRRRRHTHHMAGG